MKIRRSNNTVLQTLSGENYNEFIALCSKYDIDIFCFRTYHQEGSVECIC